MMITLVLGSSKPQITPVSRNELIVKFRYFHETADYLKTSSPDFCKKLKTRKAHKGQSA